MFGQDLGIELLGALKWIQISLERLVFQTRISQYQSHILQF